MSTERTKVISCRIDAEAAERLAKNLANKGITLRFMLENYGVNTEEGVNTLGEGVNTKNEGVNTKISKKGVNTTEKGVNTDAENVKNVVNNSVYTESEGVNTLPMETYKELMSMVSTFGMDFKEFMIVVISLLEEGLIYNDEGLKTREHDLDVTSFKERCDAMGISYQSALDKLTKGMR